MRTDHAAQIARGKIIAGVRHKRPDLEREGRRDLAIARVETLAASALTMNQKVLDAVADYRRAVEGEPDVDATS